MRAISRRVFVAGSTAVTSAAALPWIEARAAASGRRATPSLEPGDADAVGYALQQGADHWGEQLLARPNGPSFGNVKPLLGPANIASRYVTESGWYYLPFTDTVYDPATWFQQRDFSIHVADGSQITSERCWADHPAQRQYTTFAVGSAQEVFGSAVERLDEPRLWGGFLPILDNSYVDADGTKWERESFVARVDATSALVSFVRITVHRGRRGPARTTLRLFVHVDQMSRLASDGTRLTLGDDTYLVSSARGQWNEPNLDIPVDLSSGSGEVYLALLNSPAPAAGLRADRPTYQRAKEAVATYWRRALADGASVYVPEPYAMDAMRNLLLQNLVMGWQLSIGNGYEAGDPHFAFVPEVSVSVAALGEFGFLDAYRKNLQQILAKGQGPNAFPSWEQGIKLQSAANHYLLSGDPSYIRDNLATFRGYLDDFARQRADDPHGLLEKQQYGSDIPEPVYGIHLQSDAWRGMRDMGLVLGLMGEPQAAKPFLDEAAALRSALLKAIDASSEQLPDGSVYVPVSLLDPAAPKAYDLIPATRDGSYWNLTIHYALATGILPPGGDAARGLLRYLYRHGALFLGLNRFNATGINPPGVCESDAVANFPPGAAGYDAPGVDEQYGYSLLKFLGDNGQADRLVLTFYGKLTHDLTPYTFIGGEGATVAQCPDLPAGFRSQWFPPLSPNNAVYLRALRETLVHEDRDETGMPSILHITPATPRPWLADGDRVAVRDLPTLFGPVTFSISSRLRERKITAVVEPPAYAPGRARVGGIVLHVRPPAGSRLRAVTVDGRAVPFSNETVDLGRPTGTVNVVLTYRATGVVRVDQAKPTVVKPDRLLFQPGETVPLRATIEAIGDGNVPVTLTVATPDGWPSPRPVETTVASAGRIARRPVPIPVSVPAGTEMGSYYLTLTVRPRFGPAASRKVSVDVAVPSGLPYAKLVEADGPSAYWRLGETSGGSANDLSGHGAMGTYEGDVVLGQQGAIADDPDGAVRLAGGYISVPDSPAVSLTGPFTIEAWIKVTTAAQQGIVEKYDKPAFNGFVFRTVMGNKLFAQTLTASQPLPPGVSGPTTVLPGLWHHVAAVFDGSALSVYLDGARQASVASTASPTDGAGTLKLGARGDDANARLAGWLDEVAIYPKALSANRLKEHFVKGVLGTPR